MRLPSEAAKEIRERNLDAPHKCLHTDPSPLRLFEGTMDCASALSARCETLARDMQRNVG